MEKKELKDLSKNYLRPGRRFARLFQMKLIGTDPGFLFYDPETQQSLDLPAWFVRRACTFLVGVKAPPPYKKTVPKSPESLSLHMSLAFGAASFKKKSNKKTNA